MYVDKLRELSGRNKAPVGNRALRSALGWEEDRYQQVKQQLIADSQIALGKGGGGTVVLLGRPKRRGASPNTPKAVTRRASAKLPAKSRRTRRTNRDIFLQKLAELSGDGKSLVANGTLREQLEWDEERYRRIKEQLVDESAIILGRGHGGMVGLAVSKGTKGLSVFVSYSHEDEKLKSELVKHLGPLERLHRIEAWHDRKIKPGDEWEKSIASNLETADIVLLLVSIDFISSKYCYDIELETAMERHANGQAVVIPIILRSCLWHHTPFSKLQALPKDGKAVCTWADRDEALTAVAEGIRQVAETRLANK